jgi:hypothetical protein
MEIIGGSRGATKAQDTTATQLTATREGFASALLGLLGVTTPQRGLAQGNKSLVTPAANPLAGVPQYTGAVTADLTPQERSLLDAIGPQEGAARRAQLDATLSGAYLDPASNPWLAATIREAQRPVLEGLEETLGRVLPGRFLVAGQNPRAGGSSAFDRAAAIATKGAADAAAGIATNIAGQNYQAERQRQLDSVTFSQQELDSTISKLRESALPRLIEQHGLDTGLQEFRRRSDFLLSLLQVLTGATTGQVVTEGRERSSEGVLTPVAGAVAGLAG